MRNYGWNSGQDASAGQPLMESGLLETNLDEAFNPKAPASPRKLYGRRQRIDHRPRRRSPRQRRSQFARDPRTLLTTDH